MEFLLIYNAISSMKLLGQKKRYSQKAISFLKTTTWLLLNYIGLLYKRLLVRHKLFTTSGSFGDRANKF